MGTVINQRNFVMSYRRMNSVFWGIMLISAGGLFLLSELGLWSIDVWDLIFPGFLIYGGLWVLIGVLVHPRNHTAKTEAVNIALDCARDSHIHLRHRAGRLDIEGEADPDLLIAGTLGTDTACDVRRDGEALAVDLKNRRDWRSWGTRSRNWCRWGPSGMWSQRPYNGNWHYRSSKDTWPRMFGPWRRYWTGSRDWDLAINNDVALELSVDSSFSECQLDLSELQLTDLELQTNMSSVEVTLPEQVGHMRTRLRDTMSEVKVSMPAGVTARIQVSGGWEHVSVDEERFARDGSVYQSADYDSSEHQVEIDARSDMGTLTIL